MRQSRLPPTIIDTISVALPVRELRNYSARPVVGRRVLAKNLVEILKKENPLEIMCEISGLSSEMFELFVLSRRQRAPKISDSYERAGIFNSQDLCAYIDDLVGNFDARLPLPQSMKIRRTDDEKYELYISYAPNSRAARAQTQNTLRRNGLAV